MIITAVVIALVVLMRKRAAPGLIMIAATLVLLVTRVITSQEALAGLSNPSMATIAALYVIARAMQRTDALGSLVAKLLGAGLGLRNELFRLLGASIAVSAFVNNTPIVAMLAPAITTWADERKKAPSRYLLPMTYAVSIGGTLTLIGTSTNLIVSGLMVNAKLAPLGMFELTPVGIFVAIVGLLVLFLVSPTALPDRRPARVALTENQRDFATTMTVIPGGALDGRTVEAAGLRHLQGVFLIEIDRGGELISPVTPTRVLIGGDRVTLVGRADDIVDLQRIKGLSSSEHPHLASFDVSRHTFFEAVLGPASPLVGRTLKEVGFRARYQGAVVAIHRAGERLRDKLGAIRLLAGDTILFIADPGFRRNDFLLVTRIGPAPSRRRRSKGTWVGLLFVAVVLVAGTGLLPLLEVSLVGAALVIALGVLNSAEAREAIDAEVLFVVVGSFAVGAAVSSSGLGALLAQGLTMVCAPGGPRGALLGVTVLTVAFSQVLTCNSAAALAFPVSLAVARQLGLDPRPFAIAVAIGASSTYLTPLGYQTKMMVYGPGGYHFGDYFRLGAPLTVAVIATVVLVVPLFWVL